MSVDHDPVEAAINEFNLVASKASEGYKTLLLAFTTIEKLPTGFHSETRDFNRILQKHVAKFFLSVVQIAQQQILADLQVHGDELHQQQRTAAREVKDLRVYTEQEC